ncbi:MAG: TIGR02757 family protein [Candidatus Tectomicrobia bacterium]|nr:TIGR02757 family protein [Candidatus Tectomicrobia bacterium]
MGEKPRYLKEYLDQLYQEFDIRWLSPDPLEFVYKFQAPQDREVIGIIASSLAYGRVRQILKSIETVLTLMEGEPYQFVMAFHPERDLEKFQSFTHRFTKGEDIACLLYFLQQILSRYQSIYAFFRQGYRATDETIRPALIRFVEGMLSLDSSPFYHHERSLPRWAGVRYFFPSPQEGSACKRLNLFLRWMVRRGDTLDCGLWRDIAPSKLIIPLDTHVGRVAQRFALTTMKSANWKMAEQITGHLREFDPDDPVKYDFALFRLGMLSLRGDYSPTKVAL